MIVDPDFLTHWKTQALKEALEDEAAPVYVIALWAHCQLRRADRFHGIDHSTFAKICRYPFKGDSVAFFAAMKTCGFVDIEGDTIIVHGWAEVNSKLFSNWRNGRLGGRVANPRRTQQEPKNEKPDLGTLDKERIGKIGKEKKEEIYAAYPLKRAKPDALRAISKALNNHPFEFLLSQTKAYAAARNGNLAYVPNPATWFNQERFNDDPSTWLPSENGMNAAPKKERKWKEV